MAEKPTLQTLQTLVDKINAKAEALKRKVRRYEPLPTINEATLQAKAEEKQWR